MIGAPLWVVSAAGVVSRVTIASATTGSATTRRQMTALASGLQVCPGGIGFDLENAWYHLGAPHIVKAKQRTHTFFDVQSAGQLFYGCAKDQGTPTISARSGESYIDLSLSDGERAIYALKRGRNHKDRWLAIQAGIDVVIQGFRFDLATQDG